MPSSLPDFTTIEEEVHTPSKHHNITFGQVPRNHWWMTTRERSDTCTLLTQIGPTIMTLLNLVGEIRGKIMMQQVFQKYVLGKFNNLCRKLSIASLLDSSPLEKQITEFSGMS